MDKKINYSANCLAYMGDAVFEQCVRKMLLDQGNRPADALHNEARQYVSAKAQAAMYHYVESHLNTEEQSVMRRGRNLHTYSKAKNAGTSAYRHATGLETLFGYLFLNEQHERLTQIFELCKSCIRGDI
ncbi:MAG: ribonuclease III [Defluviitaleaceae bacterium]|nr:ribonuclease III [Defluviitaleaceae bacterium]